MDFGDLVATVALVLSGGSVWFTWRQHRMAKTADVRAQRAELIELFRQHLTLTLAGDGVRFTVTVKSTHPEQIPSSTIEVLPVVEEPAVGFFYGDDLMLDASWPVPALAPGQVATATLVDVRENDFSPIDVRFTVPIPRGACSWTVNVPLPRPPQVMVL